MSTPEDNPTPGPSNGADNVNTGEGQFDFQAWIIGSKLTEAGRKKLTLNAIVDYESLVYVTGRDIANFKLAAGDHSKFERHLSLLKTGKAELTVEVTHHANGPRDQEPGQAALVTQSQANVTGGTQPSGQQTYNFQEVAEFIAGANIPPTLQVEANRLHALTLPPSATLPFPPSLSDQPRAESQLQQPGASLQTALSGLQLNGQGPLGQVVQGVYSRIQPTLPYQHQLVARTFRDSNLAIVQLYTAQAQPSRQSSLQYGLPQTDIYGRGAIRDLLGINECQPSRTGEGLLLPINFCSHVRGSRGEDEEILETPNGSKLYFSRAHSSKKITPEKLTQGLFFGANARILARLVPNLTPELVLYLDYLRQLGDLLLNYTSTSVYSLDHEHRYEVAEQGTPWNEINSSLSLNLLKKKDQNAQSGSTATVNRAQNRPASSLFARNALAAKSQVICYLYNQVDGCPFGVKCRFFSQL